MNLMGSAIFANVEVVVARVRRRWIVEGGQNEKEKRSECRGLRFLSPEVTVEFDV